MSDERLLELARYMFKYLEEQAIDPEGQYEVFFDDLGMRFDEYKFLGGRLEKEELAALEEGSYED